MTAAGQLAWLGPQIYSFPAWLNQIQDDYLLSTDDERIPINAQQAQVLWQSLVDQEVFIGEPQVAELAQRAWRMIHEHVLQAPQDWPELMLSEDSRRFKDWAATYRHTCLTQGLLDEWTFATEIPGLIASGRIDPPKEIELVGFDLPETPLQQQILAAFERVGVNVSRRKRTEHKPLQPQLVQFDQPDDELQGAATWARNLLETNPQQSIAIVVPDLGGRVEQVDRYFRQTFDAPGFTLQTASAEPWHISLGKPLAEWPLITDALAILSLADQRLNQPQLVRLLRSPFLPGTADELQTRGQTLTQLTRRAPYNLTVKELQFALAQAGDNSLRVRLDAWHMGRREALGAAWPSVWAGRFQQELSSLGFASGRTLDSREYQVLQRWHELLEAFSAIDTVTDTPLPRQQALALIAHRAGNVVFRELNTGAPVEVLGVEEALGSRFDALWITTLDHNTWPGTPVREPLIPAVLQACIARATSAGCLEQTQTELAVLSASAPLIHGSFARGLDDIAVEVTALLQDAPLLTMEPKVLPAPARMAPALVDSQAPALDGTTAVGGTGVLRNQSSCPFRAFAENRLHAVDLTPPRPGLDAGQRGNVIHKTLEHFWHELDGSEALLALSEHDQQHRVQHAVTSALAELSKDFRLTLSRAGRLLEQRRTERAVHRWLEVEKQRGAFTVINHEQSISIQLAGLTLSGKIDRCDKLADGGTMLIDYKTGRTGKREWLPEARMADPQLPAYAISMQPRPNAIAFARIRPEELKFEGLAEADNGTPGVTALEKERYSFKEIDSWSDLLEDWQTHLETLAVAFRTGDATVDPRKPTICNTCHLHGLCRIAERAPDTMIDADDE